MKNRSMNRYDSYCGSSLCPTVYENEVSILIDIPKTIAKRKQFYSSIFLQNIDFMLNYIQSKKLRHICYEAQSRVLGILNFGIPEIIFQYNKFGSFLFIQILKIKDKRMKLGKLLLMRFAIA